MRQLAAAQMPTAAATKIMPIYAFEGIRPVIDPSAYVHPEAVIIGDVIIEAGCYIGPLCSLRGDFGRIHVGQGSNVQEGCVLHSFPERVCHLEQEAHVGHGAVLHGCILKPNAFVGMNAVVMDDAVIGERALVAANAFVKAGERVEPEMLMAGTPAKATRRLSEQELLWLAEGPKTYQQLALRCRVGLEPCEPLTEIEADRKAPKWSEAASTPLHDAKKRS